MLVNADMYLFNSFRTLEVKWNVTMSQSREEHVRQSQNAQKDSFLFMMSLKVATMKTGNTVPRKIAVCSKFSA